MTRRRSTKPEPGPTCGACRWFAPEEGDTGGDCHANPPQVITDGEEVATVRPYVERDDQPCRLFAAKH